MAWRGNTSGGEAGRRTEDSQERRKKHDLKTWTARDWSRAGQRAWLDDRAKRALYIALFRLSEIPWRVTFCGTMKPIGGSGESDRKDQKVFPVVRFRDVPQRLPSRDLILVRWAAWAVIAAFIGFVILVIWGLVMGKPAQFPYVSD